MIMFKGRKIGYNKIQMMIIIFNNELFVHLNSFKNKNI
jgi:hypothetical protein